MYGYAHAGVEFHRSWTVGLLLTEIPTTASVPKKFCTGLAQRTSRLSQLK